MQWCGFFSEEYPELAKVYPTNKLPDLRVNLFVAGMTDVEWMPGDNYYFTGGCNKKY